MARRRGNNEGSISRRKDGRWMGRYTVHTANGPKQRAVHGKTREEAAEMLTEAMADRARHSLRRGQADRRGVTDSVAL